MKNISSTERTEQNNSESLMTVEREYSVENQMGENGRMGTVQRERIIMHYSTPTPQQALLPNNLCGIIDSFSLLDREVNPQPPCAPTSTLMQNEGRHPPSYGQNGTCLGSPFPDFQQVVSPLLKSGMRCPPSSNGFQIVSPMKSPFFKFCNSLSPFNNQEAKKQGGLFNNQNNPSPSFTGGTKGAAPEKIDTITEFELFGNLSEQPSTPALPTHHAPILGSNVPHCISRQASSTMAGSLITPSPGDIEHLEQYTPVGLESTGSFRRESDISSSSLRRKLDFARQPKSAQKITPGEVRASNVGINMQYLENACTPVKSHIEGEEGRGAGSFPFKPNAGNPGPTNHPHKLHKAHKAPKVHGVQGSQVAQGSQGNHPKSTDETHGICVCNCKKSKCLKLYCECFALGIYCNGCNCQECHNRREYEEERQLAIDGILERNPHAFKPKVQKENNQIRHFKGCNCAKTGCLKKYCECYQNGIQCTDICKCIDCKNCKLEVPAGSKGKLPKRAKKIVGRADQVKVKGGIFDLGDADSNTILTGKRAQTKQKMTGKRKLAEIGNNPLDLLSNNGRLRPLPKLSSFTAT